MGKTEEVGGTGKSFPKGGGGTTNNWAVQSVCPIWGGNFHKRPCEAGKQRLPPPFPERCDFPRLPPLLFSLTFASSPAGLGGRAGPGPLCPWLACFSLFSGIPCWMVSRNGSIGKDLSFAFDDLTTDLLRAPHRTSKRQASSSPCLLKTCVV